MTTQEQIDNWKPHPSQRGVFAFELFKAMAANDDIWLILPDLGFGIFDKHVEHFPERVKAVGASECAAVGICVGLALQGKIPFIYSITSFLLYRPFEWHRNYLNHEGIPVRLVGSGLDDDYKHDGITHQTFDAKSVLELFPKIKTYFPSDKSEVPNMLEQMIATSQPVFICLRR